MLLRFFLAWSVNFSISTAAVWLLTSFADWNLLVTKIIVSTVLAISINFFLQKEYVFK